MFAGGHFFVQTNREQVLAAVKHALQAGIDRPGIAGEADVPMSLEPGEKGLV